MTTVTGSFTAVGVSTPLTLGRQEESVTLSVSGTYAAVVVFERAVNRAKTNWEVLGRFGVANAPVTKIYSSRPGDTFRIQVVAFTSGSVSYSISDSDATVREFKDGDGNVLLRLKQSGVEVPGTLSVSGESISSKLPTSDVRLNTFILRLRRNSGALQHQIAAINDNAYATVAVAPGVSGHSVDFTTTPTGTDGSTAMAAGVKIGSASTHVLHFDTPAQVLGECDIVAWVVGNTSDTAAIVLPFTSNIDINGTTRRRMGLAFINAGTGAALPLNLTTFDVDTEYLEVIVRAYLNPAE